MTVEDQRWERLESRLDRIEGSLHELREDFAAHKATSTANERKILENEQEHKAQIKDVRAGIRKVGWFAATSALAVIGYLIATFVIAV
jgi:hypothetical protein